jgi:hypothetical protein
MEGMLIDLTKEMVVYVMVDKDVPQEMLKTTEDRCNHKKIKAWFENNPIAKRLGVALLDHLEPRDAQGLYGVYCRYTEEQRKVILEGMKELVHAQ